MKKHTHRSSLQHFKERTENLKSKATISGVSFEEYVRDNRKIIFPFISHRFKSMGMLDLTLLPDEVIKALVQYILTVNRRRIEAGQDIVVTYAIVKSCPIWKVVKMPYRTMKLLGAIKNPDAKSLNEIQSGIGGFKNAPKSTIKPRKPS